MKDHLRKLIEAALDRLRADGVLPADAAAEVQISRPKDAEHGDFACNIAMILAKTAGKNPRELAERLVAAIEDSERIRRIEIAGPGFINFFVEQAAANAVVREALEQGEAFGRSTAGAGRRVLVEFVSANPTGPLHVGHGRGAAYGEALADLLAAAGFEVTREYYVNDAGRQMDILALSVWLRYLQSQGVDIRFPDNGYRGDYVADIAAGLAAEHGDSLVRPREQLLENVPPDESAGGDREAHVDALVRNARALLGEADYRRVFDAGLNSILADIRDDLRAFGVEYESWYSERSLVAEGRVEQTIEALRDKGHVYEQDGALWFRASDFGDDKDRVVRRDNGQPTYFAADIAYHRDKLARGYDRLIDVWGADHHGYVARVRAALEALTDGDEKLDILLVQFANLYRGEEKIPMSTRAGEFVTLRQLREEVGNGAARFFYIMRRCEQHMDFDLELAKSQSADNPVYYVQYAHARICSVFRQAEEKGIEPDRANGLANLGLLATDHEQALIKTLMRYPEVVEHAALAEEPHQIPYYLKNLANDFHTYYNAHPFLVEEAGLRDARLALVSATRQVLANALAIIGVDAPESM